MSALRNDRKCIHVCGFPEKSIQPKGWSKLCAYFIAYTVWPWPDDIWERSVSVGDIPKLAGHISSSIPHCDGGFTYWGRDKMANILQTIFSKAFSWMETFGFFKDSLKYVPYGLIDNKLSLVQIMACRLFGTSDGIIYRHIYASLGLNEFTCWGLNKMAAILQTI